jgi:phosphoglycolate phosphatase-like HAD superfamily hydrolase
MTTSFDMRMPMRVCLLAAILFAFGCVHEAAAAADPLPSWNDGPAKKSIVDFIARTTKAGGENFVPPAERIATFDNDGTLWVEQPLYTQVVFAIDRVKELAPQHPEWKTTEPFKSILTENESQLANFSIQDFAKVVAVSHTGITVEEFQAVVKKWLATAKHPRFKRPYTELAYQPMLEVLRYFRANGYKTYIVTGGGQDFVRTFAEQVYGIPPEQVVGSAGKTKYEYGQDGKPKLIKLPEVFLVDDKTGKPEGINLFIGRRPLAAFGNSTGDQQMLEWTQAGQGSRLMMLVHHDDAVREYEYGVNSKIGTFSAALMQEANRRGWVVISMKRDWRKIFSFDE